MICYRYTLWTIFNTNDDMSEYIDDRLDDESTWIKMKRKKSSLSQFDILYIQKFKRDEQNTYENHQSSKERSLNH